MSASPASPGTRAAAAVALALLLAALLAPVLAPHDPQEVFEDHRLESPSLRFPAGTDELGRCVLSRVLHGGRVSLLLSLAVVAGASFLGLAVGGAAGAAGGLADLAFVGLADLLLALPHLVLALVVIGLVGPSVPALAALLVLVDWTLYARVARAAVVAERGKPHVLAERALGLPGTRILVRTLLPAALAPVATYSVLRVGRTVLTIAALGFLGLGVPPPTAEWGTMVGQGRTFLRVAPWIVAAPALAIVLSTLAFTALAERRTAPDRTRGGVDPGEAVP